MACAAPPAGVPSKTFVSRGGWAARSATTRSRPTCGTCCAGCTAPASTWASATRRRARRAPPTRGSSCSSSRSSSGGPSRTKTSSSPLSCATASGCWNDRPLAASRRRHGLARRVRASPCRRREAARGRSFQHPDAVAQLRGELEVFVLDGPPELLLELEQLEPRVGGALRTRRRVALAHVLAGAVQPAQQVPQVGRERVVTLRAPQPPRLAKILEGAPAGGAAQPIGRGEIGRA